MTVGDDSRRQCLVVDDNCEIFTLLEAALASDYQCHYAQDAFTAHQYIGKKTFDIILCDIRMPHMDGFGFLEELNRELVKVPIIFISGMIDGESVRKAFQLGAANIIAKPIDLNELYEKVETAVRMHEEARRDGATSDQEIGYVYNLLKSYYYDIHAILYQIHLHKIPLQVVKEELDKKQRIGKCHLDDPESIKFLNKVA